MIFLQTQNLVCKGTLEIAAHETVCVNDTGQILVRVQVNDRYYIRVMNPLRGEVSSEFPTKCHHFSSCLIAHPTDAGFVLESCGICEVTRNYNIHSGQCSIVCKDYITHRICHGPILTYQPHLEIFKWDKEHHELRTDKSMDLESRWNQICYSELCDMFVDVYQFKEIKAVKLETEAATLKLSAPMWKLSGLADGLVILPDAITSDKKGNVYVGDGLNNRILKINSLTGTVHSNLHLEERNRERINSLFWSDTEPNLIVRRGDRISFHCIPRPG